MYDRVYEYDTKAPKKIIHLIFKNMLLDKYLSFHQAFYKQKRETGFVTLMLLKRGNIKTAIKVEL